MQSTHRAGIVVLTAILLSGCAAGAPASTPVPSASIAASPVTSTPAPATAKVAPSEPTAGSPSGSSGSATPAQATPSATPTATPVAAIPKDLQYRWIGALRDVPQISPKTNFTGLELSAHTTWFYPYTQGDGNDLRSTTSSPAPGELTFVTASDITGCTRNDTGTYKYTLDPSKTRLTLTAATDPCAARSAAFSGEWTRSACPDAHSWCLGDLGSGEYQSALFTPFTPSANWTFHYGEMSYTVPAGWSNPEDGFSGYVLAQQNAPEFTAIYLFADVRAHAQGTDCAEILDPTVGTSAADITDYLTKLPSAATTKPAPVTIGGLRGSTLDVSVDPSWTGTCPYSGGKPAAQLFSDADPNSDFDWGLVGDGRLRLFVLALPNDRTLLIDIESTDKPTWDVFLPEAMPVVQSFVFSQ